MRRQVEVRLVAPARRCPNCAQPLVQLNVVTGPAASEQVKPAVTQLGGTVTVAKSAFTHAQVVHPFG